ncbi:MAG: sensor histidine kinase [Flavobacteriales bacterium]
MFVIYGGFVLFLILSVAMVFFVIAYKRTQNAYIIEKNLLQKEFQNELLASQLEISEQTMKQIAQEIHDNIGQRITLAIQLNAKDQSADELQLVLSEALEDLRQLSQSLHSTKILDMGLDLALERECELIAKASGKKCEYEPPTDFAAISEQEEIILFRCAQELLNNALKHSKADVYKVRLTTNEKKIELEVADNGIGFDSSEFSQGLGMTSLSNRVALLNGELNIISSPNEGAQFRISINREIESHEN